MSRLLFKDGITERDNGMQATDRAALTALVQAAVNVELFTIPLYMTALYSLQGTHQINGQNNLYQGRFWPGMAPVAAPVSPNDKAFNAIFSVMIAEMLHLQLAANICNAVGVTPSFTSAALQNEQQGWTCYDKTNTVIPHIIDLLDLKSPADQIKVTLGPVNVEQIALFMAIEESEKTAHDIIKPAALTKYFRPVPFADWTPDKKEQDLPLFGSIGYMYLCLWDYLSIKYQDGHTLWDIVFKAGSLQQDLFNNTTDGHQKEYPGMSAGLDQTDESDAALKKILDMIDGITDQGEGSGVVAQIKQRLGLLDAVEPQYQPDEAAMASNNPSYNDQGEPAPSSDAAARSQYGSMDHFETFTKVMELLIAGAIGGDRIVTWDDWHKAGNSWTAEMLESADTGPYNDKLPSGQAIAQALNNLKNDPDGANFHLFSQTAAGSIAGVTTVLNTYWTKGGQFPFPAMSGTGDRMAICWAIFGAAADLSVGVPKSSGSGLYNGCQGMNLTQNTSDTCASTVAYHTCKGSNNCMSQGGCGFINTINGGSGCSSKMQMMKGTRSYAHGAPKPGTANNGCSPVFYSAPADNRCNTFGGCAVPISASQLFPAPPANMAAINIYDFPAGSDPVVVDHIETFAEGTPVYDIAWQAYCKVLESRKSDIPASPPPVSDIRLAFPPST